MNKRVTPHLEQCKKKFDKKEKINKYVDGWYFVHCVVQSV